MRKKIYQSFIELTNSLPLSKGLMTFSKSKLSKRMIPSYAKLFMIEQEEMGKNIAEYTSLHDLFIRELKIGSRQISALTESVSSPVDAVAEQFGTISEHSSIVVKNQQYSIEEMLENKELAKKYIGGQFIVLYLSPRHYHRIHSPIDGEITEQYNLGSASYPVNRWGLTYGKAPLSRNFRKVTEMVCGLNGGHAAVIKVGAMFINSIETTHVSKTLKKGEEMGYFSFGSTVVLLFEKDRFRLSPGLQVQSEVKMGEEIASVLV
ncbi:phosphatidylserine decarboxylase [Bacillus lacus]|uniref:phosphatidylserine decarboxylase n=1 Tax=Metabacillus lacus TaxID=1983721 RepID=A0A7X2LZ58_9BACI|nr:phosphatidylserine decarboxylase [Metabacillus lacus]MRX71344.1 phosphatidylserine decarboxylase [Metabacillus lacus]